MAVSYFPSCEKNLYKGADLLIVYLANTEESISLIQLLIPTVMGGLKNMFDHSYIDGALVPLELESRLISVKRKACSISQKLCLM